MKRGNIVLNRRLFKRGKALADWAKSGMNWADGPARDAVMRQGRAVVADPVLCQTLVIWHNNLLEDIGEHQATQSTVSATLAALVDGDPGWRNNLLLGVNGYMDEITFTPAAKYAMLFTEQDGLAPGADPHLANVVSLGPFSHPIGTEQELITCPIGEDWGTRTVEHWSDGRAYNHGYRAGGTWVDGWWS